MHEINLENAKILDRAQRWKQRFFLEAWHSVHDTDSIYEHISFANTYMYKNLKNF